MFKAKLAEDLAHDTQRLTELLNGQGPGMQTETTNRQALHKLLTQTHGKDKVLVAQFADTARYLAREARKADRPRSTGHRC